MGNTGMSERDSVARSTLAYKIIRNKSRETIVNPLLRILWLRNAGISALKHLMNLTKIIHTQSSCIERFRRCFSAKY